MESQAQAQPQVNLSQLLQQTEQQYLMLQNNINIGRQQLADMEQNLTEMAGQIKMLQALTQPHQPSEIPAEVPQAEA